MLSLVNSAVNTTLPAFAAAPLLLSGVACYRWISPGRGTLSSKPAALAVERRHRQTDGRLTVLYTHRRRRPTVLATNTSLARTVFWTTHLHIHCTTHSKEQFLAPRVADWLCPLCALTPAIDQYLPPAPGLQQTDCTSLLLSIDETDRRRTWAPVA